MNAKDSIRRGDRVSFDRPFDAAAVKPYGSTARWMAAALLLFAGEAPAAGLTIYGDLTQQGTSSSCSYSTATATAGGSWAFNCATGASKTLTITPALCGSVCTYSSLTETSAGNWSANC